MLNINADPFVRSVVEVAVVVVVVASILALFVLLQMFVLSNI